MDVVFVPISNTMLCFSLVVPLKFRWAMKQVLRKCEPGGQDCMRELWASQLTLWLSPLAQKLALLVCYLT